jgi:hypothetical protein
MATIRYDQLTQLVLPEVQGCSDPLAEQAIRDAVVEFCQRSRVWVHFADNQDVVAGQAAYDIEPPTGAMLVEVKNVKYNGKTIEPMPVDELDSTMPGWKTLTGTPSAYTQINDDEFLLALVPDVSIASGLEITLVVAPSRSSQSFPDWINNRYQDAIMASAKSRLMLKQGTNWYNPQQGLAYKQDFDRACSSGNEASTLSLLRSSVRTTSQH